MTPPPLREIRPVRKAPRDQRTSTQVNVEWARSARLSVLLAAAALGIATLAGAALAWDGSYWLFKTLDAQTPWVANGRYSNIFFEWPVIVFSRLTDNPLVLRTVYGVPYAAIPLGALAASWWVVHKSAPRLFLWAAFGIALAVLPDQFCLVCEGQFVVQLFWPVVLILLVGLTKARAALIAVVVPLMIFFHPLSAMLFGLGAGIAVLMALSCKERRREMLAWGAAFLVIAALDVLRQKVLGTDWEATQLTVSVLQDYFQRGLAGLPLLAVTVSWVAGGFLLAARFRRLQRVSGVLELGAVVCILAVGITLVMRTLEPALWRDAVLFKSFAVYSAAPFMLYAVLDILFHRRSPSIVAMRPSQRLVAPLILFVFLVVLMAQSMVFQQLSQKALADVRARNAPCVEKASIAVVRDTPLDWWFTTYALVMQGRTPQTLVLDSPGCLDAAGSGLFNVVAWEDYQGGGWYRLDRPRSAIGLAEPCVLFLSTGWYPVEQYPWGWWAWNGGHGEVQVISKQAATARLTGFLASQPLPNQVDVRVNGTLAETVTLGAGEEAGKTFDPIAIQLQSGDNSIEFRSHAPAIKTPTAPEPVAVAVSGLRIEAAENGFQCTMKTSLAS